MFAIIKIVGVTPDAVGRLHKILAGVDCQTKDEVTVNIGGGNSSGRQKYVQIEESKFDSSHGTYTITLKFFLCFTDRSEDYHTYQPITVLRSVFQAIDPNLLPDKEVRLPTPETARKLRKEELGSKIEELETALKEKMASLVDKSTQTLLKTPDGRIILPGGEKVERHQHHWNLLNWDLMKLDLPDVDDKFVATLREAQESSREIDRLRKEKDLL
jgi:hypothetical protein